MRVFKGGKANCLIGTAMALSLAAGAHAVAQTAPPAPAPAASAAAGDEAVTEVVVTARRKTENAQTVPVSVTAIDSSTLATQGIESTNDLQRLVPGVILNGAGSITNSTYTIRGQGKSTTGPGLPSVITYIDEVPLTSTTSRSSRDRRARCSAATRRAGRCLSTPPRRPTSSAAMRRRT